MAAASDLTVDTLCQALRHFLRDAAEHPSSQACCLDIWGTPADDTMKAVMAMTGGTLKITVRELPTEMANGLALVNDVAGENSGINLWQPHSIPVKAAIVAEKGVLDDECSTPEPAGAGSRS